MKTPKNIKSFAVEMVKSFKDIKRVLRELVNEFGVQHRNYYGDFLDITAGKKTTSAITPGASPYAYQNTSKKPEIITIEGGTVTQVDYSTDGSNFYDTGVTAGPFVLPHGMYLKVTYSVAPTMRKYL